MSRDSGQSRRSRNPDQNPDQKEFADASRGERLQRVMAGAGIASRRECERFIEEGRVEVNGRPITDLPAWVDPHSDTIVVNGRRLPPPERHLYILLNKPARTLSTARDEPGADRRTVLDLVDHPIKAKLFPVGRLDYDTVGLVLLTNDGELANHLTHPRYGVAKTYRAVVRGEIGEDQLAELERGIYLAERREGQTVGAVRTSRVELRVVHAERGRTTLEITLREGRNRQVRRMLASVGLPVKKLERVAMGPLSLKGVARGSWRELTNTEVQRLRRAGAIKPGPSGKSAGKSSKKTGSSGKTPGGRATAGRRPN